MAAVAQVLRTDPDEQQLATALEEAFLIARWHFDMS